MKTQPVLRRSSVYEFSTEGDEALLRTMISKLHKDAVEISGTGIDPGGKVFVRVRVANDSEALEAALAACDGRSFTLVTGYGINRRELYVGRIESTDQPAPSKV